MKVLIDIEMILRANYFISKKLDGNLEKTFITCANKNLDNIISTVNREHRIKKVILCRDSKSFRYNILSTYKSGRHDDDVYNNLAKLFYEQTNYLDFKVDNLEADDILYILANGEDNSLIVSNDHDLQQADALLFSPTLKKIIEKQPIDYYRLILKGCSSDTIPALIKTYTKNKVKDLPNYHELSKEMLVEVLANTFRIDEDKVLANIELVLYREDTYLKHVPKEFTKCQQFL